MSIFIPFFYARTQYWNLRTHFHNYKCIVFYLGEKMRMVCVDTVGDWSTVS